MWVDRVDDLDLNEGQKVLLSQVQKLTPYFRAISQNYALRCVAESWQTFDVLPVFVEVFKNQSRFWLREIVHVNGAQVLAYAHTVVPQQTFLAFEQTFVHLKDRSIGEAFLYQQQAILRSSFKFALLDDRFEGYDKICEVLGLKSGEVIPARASVFYVETLPLLIIEFFHLRSMHVSEN